MSRPGLDERVPAAAGDTYLRIRMPASGLLIGEAVAAHPGASAVAVFGRSQAIDGGAVANNVVRFRAVGEPTLQRLEQQWLDRYGLAARRLDDETLWLPARLDSVAARGIASLYRFFETHPRMASRLADGLYEMWLPLPSPEFAQEEAGRIGAFLRKRGSGHELAVVVPDPQDVSDWEALRASARRAGAAP